MATSIKGKDPILTLATGGGLQRTMINDIADGRDILSSFAGGGHTALNSKDLQSAFTRLSGLVGVPLAQKLTNQAFLYNQRPETKVLTPEQRVNGFFALGSSDPEVHNYLRQGQGIGYGVIDGFRHSPLVSNRQLQGKDIGSGRGSAQTVEKIKSLVGRYTKQ